MSQKDSDIPAGWYCYEILGVSLDGKIQIRLCPHWTQTDNVTACSFLGIDDKDNTSLLWDQCKECDVNYEWED